MDSSSTPLAEYFWIAGIGHISYDDVTPAPPANQFEDTIAEDGEAEAADSSLVSPARTTVRHSRQTSASRLSKLSSEGQLPDDFDGNTKSNRSSATIRPIPSPITPNRPISTDVPLDTSLLVPDFDFDKALVKFAAERENFLDDLSFSAGAKLQSRPPMVNPRAEKVKNEDADASGRKSPLMKNFRGSIRRKISFRDMNSARKQPSASRPGICSCCVSPATVSNSPISCTPFTPLVHSFHSPADPVLI